MTFHPRMHSQTTALHMLRPLRWRRWPGVVADVWLVRGESGGGGFYTSPDPRVVVFLDKAPATMELRTGADGAGRVGVSAFYVPPHAPLWTHINGEETFSHLDLHLEAGPLAQRMRGQDANLDAPVFVAGDPGLGAIATLIASEVETPRRAGMMVDGLLSALLAELFRLPAESERVAGGLAPRQRAAIRRHLRANLCRRVRNGELASVAGLSESWFLRAFKVSEGETVQRWQTRLRVEAAAEMMMDEGASLAEIASATGFADQAHLTRAFRALHGQTPSRWRRDRSADAAPQRRSGPSGGGPVQDPRGNPT